MAYFLLCPDEIRSLPALPLGATDKEEQAKAIRLGVNLPLAFYGLLLCGAMLWLWFQRFRNIEAAWERTWDGRRFSGAIASCSGRGLFSDRSFPLMLRPGERFGVAE
jgi:hypothetical protein